jgi:hypothetical protein
MLWFEVVGLMTLSRAGRTTSERFVRLTSVYYALWIHAPCFADATVLRNRTQGMSRWMPLLRCMPGRYLLVHPQTSIGRLCHALPCHAREELCRWVAHMIAKCRGVQQAGRGKHWTKTIEWAGWDVLCKISSHWSVCFSAKVAFQAGALGH